MASSQEHSAHICHGRGYDLYDRKSRVLSRVETLTVGPAMKILQVGYLQLALCAVAS